MKASVADIVMASAAGPSMVFDDELVRAGGIDPEQRMVRVVVKPSPSATKPKKSKKAERAKAKAARKQSVRNRR
jgi:hypothetical protein